MNKALVMLLLGVLGTIPVAADDVLINLAEHGLGGYGGPHFKVGPMNDGMVVLAGGTVCLLSGPSLGIALDWYNPDGPPPGGEIFHAGIRPEYTLFPSSRFHLSLSAFAGYGRGNFYHPDTASDEAYKSDYYVIEPEVMLSLDVGRGERIGIGGSYRFVAGLKEVPWNEDLRMSGPTVNVKLSYGLFPGVNPARKNIHTFGAGSLRFYAFGGKIGVMKGGGTRIRLRKDHWYLGIGGYVSWGDLKIQSRSYYFAYGALWSEYVINPESLIKFSLSNMMGPGGVSYHDTVTDQTYGTGMIAASPTLHASFNLTEFIQLSAGVGYRVAYTFSDLPDMGRFAASAPNIALQIRHGLF